MGYVTGFAAVQFKDIMIWSILGTSLISSLLGAWAVYKYGVIQDQIDRLKKEFEGLVDELRNIAGDNQDILALLDNTNKIFNDMRKVVLENERAHLLSTFYECAFRDDDNRMDEDEYKRFLGRLSVRQRDKFKALGDFKTLAGDDDHIDLQEFQDMLEEVLTEVDELLKQEFAKQ